MRDDKRFLPFFLREPVYVVPEPEKLAVESTVPPLPIAGLGKKGVLVLMHEPEYPFLSPADQTFLDKVLQAIELIVRRHCPGELAFCSDWFAGGQRVRSIFARSDLTRPPLCSARCRNPGAKATFLRLIWLKATKRNGFCKLILWLHWPTTQYKKFASGSVCSSCFSNHKLL